MPSLRFPHSSFRLAITGTPGTGKSQLARFLNSKMGFGMIEEKALIRKHGIGVWDSTQKEYEVDVSALKKVLQREIRNITKQTVIVGHLLCEIRLPVNGIIILTCSPTLLEKRLRKRNYSDLKIQENLFCEEEKYCEKKVRAHYRGIPVRVTPTNRAKKVICEEIINWIQSIKFNGGNKK